MKKKLYCPQNKAGEEVYTEQVASTVNITGLVKSYDVPAGTLN